MTSNCHLVVNLFEFLITQITWKMFFLSLSVILLEVLFACHPLAADNDGSQGEGLKQSYYNPYVMEKPGCDRRSVSQIVDEGNFQSFKPKEFPGCVVRFGELAMIANFIEQPIQINCSRQASKIDILQQGEGYNYSHVNQTLSVDHLAHNKLWVLDVYVNPEDDYQGEGPKWTCEIKRVNVDDYGKKDKITFEPFADYKIKDAFEFEVREYGLYEANPRLVRPWTTRKDRF